MRALMLAFLAAAMLLLPGIHAQVRSGTISGKVADSSGAAITGAKVAVIEQQTNQRYEVATNEAGEFAVPYRPAGIYTVEVKSPSFAEYRQVDIPLANAQSLRVNITLSVAAIEQSVTVRASAAQLQTENATVSNAMGDAAIQSLPNVNRNAYFFAAIQQGIVPRARFYDSTGPNSFGIGIEGRRQFSAFSANGGQAFTNDIQVDGVSVQGSAWNEAAVLPNPDGIQEMRTNINNFSAEYGRAQAVVIVTTKSGTNEFHGTASFRHRNDALNANTWGNNARGIARPEFKVYTFGGTLGGPVIRDKTFFFASYEGLRFDQGVNFLRTVPTELERKGDFSKTLVNVAGTPTPLVLYDPFSVVSQGNNVYRRAPVPGSVISRPHPGILRLFSNYPLPNRTPDDPFNSNNFLNTDTREFRRHNLNSRLDHRVGTKHSLYLVGGLTKGQIDTPSSWGRGSIFNNSAEGFALETGDDNPYAAIGDTWVLSSTLVADIRYGVNRVNTRSLTPAISGFDYGQFGIPAHIQAANALPGVPPNMFVSGNSRWSPLSTNAYQHKHERQTNHHLVGSMTKTYQRWTLKFGGEFRNWLSNYTDNQESISYRLNSIYSAGPLINAVGSLVSQVQANENGDAFASLLMGAGNLEIGRGFNVKPAFSQKYFALYTQNDWRPTSRLTVNLGLRWDFQAPPTERYNRISSFDYEGTNPYGTPGRFVFAGSTTGSRYLWKPQYKDFGPRVGLAYRLTDTTVIRAGYGLSYLPTNTGYFNGPFTYGMASFAPFTDAQPFGLNPQGVLAGDFGEVTRVVEPTRDDPTAPGLYGNASPRFRYDPYRNGKSQQWNLFVQRQLGSEWLVSVGYAASRGTQLPIRRRPTFNAQFLPDALLQEWRAGYIARNGTTHPGQDLVRNPFQPASGPLIPFLGNLGNATLQLIQTLAPYPHFLQMQTQQTYGFSNYHSFQAQVQKSFSKGLLIQAHYTWSKMIQFSALEVHQNGFQDGAGEGSFHDVNLRDNYMLANTDIPHRLVATYVWEPPFGRGQAWDVSNPVLRAVASGWRFGGNVILQTGTPDSIGGATNGAINGRNHRLEGVPIEVPKELQRWYDGRTTVTLPSGRRITPCAFCFLKYSSDAFVGGTVVVPNGQIRRDQFWVGTASTFFSDFRQPNLYTWNLTVQRSVRLAERKELEFTVNFQNVLNHPIFGDINGGVGNTEIRNNPAQGILPGYGDSANFGTHGTATVVDPRQVELVVRFRF